MKWLSLMPEELEPGDFVFNRVIESIEPVESAMECLIVFEDGSDRRWPWQAPVRAGRSEGLGPATEDVVIKGEFL